MTTYTARFEDPAFKEQTKTVEADPLGHDWEVTGYRLSDDGKAIIATCTCRRDPAHTETGYAAVVRSEVRKAPKESEPGETLYITEAFEAPVSCPEEITLPDIPALRDMEVLRLPAGVKSISEEAFAGARMEAVIIPENCGAIVSMAFANCERLKFVYIYGDIGADSVAEDAFAGSSAIIVCQEDSGAEQYAQSREIGYLTAP